MKERLTYFLFPALGLAMLPVPLLRDFHFESAIVAAVIGCFWAAFSSAKNNEGKDFRRSLSITAHIYLMGIPLFLFALFSGCLTYDGILFWLLIPLPSVFYGAAMGRFVRFMKWPKPVAITFALLLFTAVGIWLIEFFSYPQVYYFNHVWGMWPGPIYDEEVRISVAFLYFRWLTFLWIILLWFIPQRNKNRRIHLLVAVTFFVLMLSYLNLDAMRIISPNTGIQQKLGGHYQTEHFELYFASGSYAPEEIHYWAARHEFYLQQLLSRLEMEWPRDEKIQSYLYAHAWQKKAITGAKFTSYVPIWLSEGQLHIAKQQLEFVLKHELAHVVSRQFGNRLYNGSISIGLIEGLAEGLAEDASRQSTLHQIVAAEKPLPTAQDMSRNFSLFGFYGSAGAISYTTAGSFVKYLMDEFPAQHIKDVYARGNFEEVYGHSFEELVTGWHQVLNETQIDSVDQQISEFIFAQRSLFQKKCPHAVSREQELWDTYRRYQAEEDTLQARKVIETLFGLFPKNSLVFSEWAHNQLQRQQPYAVLAHFPENDTLLSLQFLKADALAMHKGLSAARPFLESLIPRQERSNAVNFRYSVTMREDSLQWRHHLRIRYENILPEADEFLRLNAPNKVQALQKAVESGKHSSITEYSRLMLPEPIHTDFFEAHLQQIDKLVFMREFELARRWLEKMAQMELRAQYQNRLADLKEWLAFMEN